MVFTNIMFIRILYLNRFQLKLHSAFMIKSKSTVDIHYLFIYCEVYVNLREFDEMLIIEFDEMLIIEFDEMLIIKFDEMLS